MHYTPYNWASPYIVIQPFTDAADFFAVRQNMLGIQARAEGAGPPALAVVYSELTLWVVAFIAFLVAEAGLVVRRDWLRPGLAASATSLLTVGRLLAERNPAQGNIRLR